MNPFIRLAVGVIGIAVVAGCASSQASKEKSDATLADAKAYPLKTCIVTDDKLEKDAHTFVYNGQQVKLCCEGCKEDFDKDPPKYLKKLAAK